jgi:hypothetical protein
MSVVYDELDRVGAGYLEHLTDADLRTLVRAEEIPDPLAERRMQALRREPALVLDVLDRPDTCAALLNIAAGPSTARFSFISPFLLFAAAVHRTASDLARTFYVPERTTARMRVPVFDTAQLANYLAEPRRRLFLAELLASFSRTSSGVTVTRTSAGVRRRRWNDTDPVRLAVLLEATPDAQRPGVWRRLGDLSLFLTGVFPDAAERSAPGALPAVRLARLTGIAETPQSDLRARELLEWFGVRWYRLAAERSGVPASVTLADSASHFHEARRVLNAATDRYLFPITTEWFGGLTPAS